MKNIKQSIIEVYKVDPSERSRVRLIVEARQAFCYFCRKYTKERLSDIGEVVGVNHSSVTYSSQAYAILLMYPEVRTLADQVESKIKSYGMQDVINK